MQDSLPVLHLGMHEREVHNMDYSVHMLARAEHELRARSQPPEEGYVVIERRRKRRLPLLWLCILFTILLHLASQ